MSDKISIPEMPQEWQYPRTIQILKVDLVGVLLQADRTGGCRRTLEAVAAGSGCLPQYLWEREVYDQLLGGE